MPRLFQLLWLPFMTHEFPQPYGRQLDLVNIAHVRHDGKWNSNRKKPPDLHFALAKNTEIHPKKSGGETEWDEKSRQHGQSLHAVRLFDRLARLEHNGAVHHDVHAHLAARAQLLTARQ